MVIGVLGHWFCAMRFVQRWVRMRARVAGSQLALLPLPDSRSSINGDPGVLKRRRPRRDLTSLPIRQKDR